jgi:L-glyceraldehyde 3-phosphate reductase
MWPGAYGNFGSRKYLVASLDQSLKRLGLEYVDIYYHHRPDPETPVEESIQALGDLVKAGKAIYAGISSYSAEQTAAAAQIAKDQNIPLIIHQPVYNMFRRWIEDGLTAVLEEQGMGCIVFSPLAQGLLTNKYLKGIPDGSRASKPYSYLKKEAITKEKLATVSKLNDLALSRGQSLAQMAISWVLRKPAVTSALIGASRPEQIQELIQAVDKAHFTEEELKVIDKA